MQADLNLCCLPMAQKGFVLIPVLYFRLHHIDDHPTGGAATDEVDFSKAFTVSELVREHLDLSQDQDSVLVKCRNDSHSPGPVIRELVPSSHQRSELSNTIFCIFSR